MGITMLERDIQGQPESFREHADKICAIRERVTQYIQDTPIIFTGIATSLYALQGAYSHVAYKKRCDVELINTGDLLDYGHPQTRDDRPLVILSRSGESAEIIRLIRLISKERVVIGITEGANSPLAERSTVLLDFDAREMDFPNTSSFTLSQLYALAIVHALNASPDMEMRNLLSELNDLGEMIVNSNDGDEIGSMVAEAQGVILEGQGYLTGVVHQYALDFHETRTMCIPVVGGIMRHGPIELTRQRGVVTLMLFPDDGIAGRKISLAEELSSQGHQVAVVTNSNMPISEKVSVMRLPRCSKELNGLVFTLGMQQVYRSYVRQKGLTDLTPDLVGKVTRRE